MDKSKIVFPRMKVNVCDKQELMKLPGVGPKVAESIIQLRAYGPLNWEKLTKLPYVKPCYELFSVS